MKGSVMNNQTEMKNITTFEKISAFAFLPIIFMCNELLVHDIIYTDSFNIPRLPIFLLAALALGLLFNAIMAFIPDKPISRIFFGVLIFASCFFAGMEYCLKQLFGTFFSISSAVKMAPEILNHYTDTVGNAFVTFAPTLFCFALPIILYLFFAKKLFAILHSEQKTCTCLLLLAAATQAGSVALCVRGQDSNSYFAGFTTDKAITAFGLSTDAQLELTYAFTGIPQNNFSFENMSLKIKEDPTLYNVIDLDFEEKANKESDSAIQDIDHYVSTIIPSEQNEYTGIFKEKNLIMICAESFSPTVIDKTLTPTLYKLTHEGFVFTDFYQPLWGQSTTGGEFSFMTGLIPTEVNGTYSYNATIGHDMYYSPGWQFRNLGYNTKAFHNGYVEFYDRHLTHPNMGYDFAAQEYAISVDGTVDPDGALDFSTPAGPADDELFEQTIPGLIRDYTENKTPFHAYYMTYSGHGEYAWDYPQAQRNMDGILSAYPNISEPAGAYLAYNMDLENAMTYLIDQINTAGIGDDTVICMVADHYPYFLLEGNADYYNELTGNGDSERDIPRFSNTLLLWSGSMVEDPQPEAQDQIPELSTKSVIGPITINTPCTAVDVLPTLYNLFGISYDARLFSGRDILAPDREPRKAYNGMPVAVIPTAAGVSWKTNAGTYDANTDTFTPKEGVTISDDYVSTVQMIVDAKYAYAQRMIETDYYRSIDNALAEKAAKEAEKNNSEKQKK